MHISLGFPDLRDQSSLPVLKRVQAGIARVRALKGTSKRVRLPITLQVLSDIGSYLESCALQEKALLWAIACTAFFGFFRLGELLPSTENSFNPATDIIWGDVSIDSHSAPTMFQVHLKKSKCDQLGEGADIIIGATGSKVCPVRDMLSFISVRGSSSGAFFVDS